MSEVQAQASRGRLGKYELIRCIAVGGMAEVYLARNTGIDGWEKQVVLKRILPSLATNDDFVRMFLDEARLVAQLHHPNIAQVYDIGREGDNPFFVMEWVHGKDVRDLLRRATATGGVPLEHGIAIICGVAAGLHYAHEHHIVHRDVSPANVIVTYEGGVKLVDFGVAKARHRHTETRAGTLKGKIAYMSPEQCRGEEVDRRSDVFALGIVMWELTVGRPLFHGTNELKLLQQIATVDAPMPSTLMPGYPLELEKVVMKALQRDPLERYSTTEELHVALERYAARARLSVSTVALRRYMRELFHDDQPERAPSADPTARPEPPITVELESDPAEEWATAGADSQVMTTQVPSPLAEAETAAPRSFTQADLAIMHPVVAWPIDEGQGLHDFPLRAPMDTPLPIAPDTPPPAPLAVPLGSAVIPPAVQSVILPTAVPPPAVAQAEARRVLLRRAWMVAGIAGLALLVILALRPRQTEVVRSAPVPMSAAPTPAAALPAPAPAPVPPPAPVAPPGYLEMLSGFTTAAVVSPAPPSSSRKHLRAKRGPGEWDPDSPFLPVERPK